jgi:nicotinate-nucleotide adenylyltransferase
MEFFLGAPSPVGRLGILAGTFNPVTVAHLALSDAALNCAAVDQVVLILPRALPHKEFAGADFGQRVDMLTQALAKRTHYAVAASAGGLFIDIARECRLCYPPDTRLRFLCGTDAAERIVNWDYGAPGAFSGMLREFDLLVASRHGPYIPLPEYRKAIHPLPLAGDFEHVSASEVRARAASGAPWEHLVPPAIREQVRKIYA